MKYVSLILLLSLFCVVGCGPVKTPAQRASEAQEHIFPEGATNVNELGKGWWTFDLEIDGQKRSFLYHRERVYKGGYESMTELQPR